MNFIEYDQQMTELQQRSMTQVGGLLEEMARMIRNGFGSDPRIDDLMDDTYSIWIDYKARERQLLNQLIGRNDYE